MIPDRAIEAAARALVPAVWGPQVWQFAAHGETPTAARDRVRKQALEDARRALEAAAPYLMAQKALDAVLALCARMEAQPPSEVDTVRGAGAIVRCAIEDALHGTQPTRTQHNRSNND